MITATLTTIVALSLLGAADPSELTGRPARIVETVRPPEAPLVVHLNPTVETAGRFVRLVDVVHVRSDRDGVWNVLSTTVVRIRDGRFIRRADVTRRLRDAGLDPKSFRVEGPALCERRSDGISTPNAHSNGGSR